MKLTLHKVNELNQEDFIDMFGPLFEHSPWGGRAGMELAAFCDGEGIDKCF
ncbi:2-oxo-4-hydroxy-4-carboxy--5-ureidoimidazoline (OHCU) decarboxylase [Paenibacillus sp. V4I9]|uniref:hypothetical protein n=1 Tax=Paenibacillus sp. V4I9 TaxID=3042308 RepID=UPI002789D778|nr:hypothetical protein [Paenibacillus sp. V4I9]MDQ0884926.1 2-oxo-4-hydroxy-4-carboxy--5-ureidoimidazoline (OHCU) decarboxylase [Paenibacillus sp. V4I9]